VFLLAALPGGAARGELTVDPADRSLVLRGTLLESQAAFSGNVRLTAVGADLPALQILASDLVDPKRPDAPLERSCVSIPAGTTLTKDEPRDVRVTVGPVTRPGTYKGKLRFHSPGKPKDDVEIDLTVEAHAKPAVGVLPQTPTARVARPSRLFGWMLPSELRETSWVITLDNQTAEDLAVVEKDVYLRGERTGQPPAGAGAAMQQAIPDTLPAGRSTQVRLPLPVATLQADHYLGRLRLRLKRAADPLVVNLDLSVRSAPGWALAALLLGILVGRVARQMGTPAAQLQVALLPRVYKLQRDAATVRDPAARSQVEQELAALDARVERATETQEAIAQDLDKLAARVAMFRNLQNLHDVLGGAQYEGLLAELQPVLNQAWNATIRGDLAAAAERAGAIRSRLAAAQADQPMGGGALGFEVIIAGMQQAGDDALEALKPPTLAQPPGGAMWNWLARLLAFLSGFRDTSARVRFWLFQPLLFVVLLVALLLLGFNSLYINAGATFGVNGVYDYLGLFLWGISSDVAQRGLQQLAASK
jgi:hypothetical protein